MNWAGCTGYGAPTATFPGGEPIGPMNAGTPAAGNSTNGTVISAGRHLGGDPGCAPDSIEYIVSLYIWKGLLWAVTLGSAKLGILFAPFFLMFSTAMAGATMTV